MNETRSTTMELASGSRVADRADWPPYPAAPYYTPPFFVGGFSGSKFMTDGMEKPDGRTVNKLDLWWNSKTLLGVRLSFSDDRDSNTFGSQSGEHAQLTLQPGEVVTSLTLWGNGTGTRCGRVKIVTTQQTFDHGKEVSGQTPYSAPVGSGVLMGIAGRCGAELDMLGFVFLTEIRSITVEDLKYVEEPSKGFLQLLTLDEGLWNNGPGEEEDWELADSEDRTVSTSWSTTKGISTATTLKVSIKASIFDIGGSAETDKKWEQTAESMHSETQTSDRKLIWKGWGKVKENTTVDAKAVVLSGNIPNLPYSANIKVLLESGQQFSYAIKGRFSGVNYGKATVTKTEYPYKGSN